VDVVAIVNTALELCKTDAGMGLAFDASQRRQSVEKWKTDIVRFEMQLLQGLRFELICFHPFRPALFLLQKANLGSDCSLVSKVQSNCVSFYVHGNWVLIHPPSILACAAVLAALSKDSTQQKRLLELCVAHMDSVDLQATTKQQILDLVKEFLFALEHVSVKRR